MRRRFFLKKNNLRGIGSVHRCAFPPYIKIREWISGIVFCWAERTRCVTEGVCTEFALQRDCETHCPPLDVTSASHLCSIDFSENKLCVTEGLCTECASPLGVQSASRFLPSISSKAATCAKEGQITLSPSPLNGQI